LPLHRKDTRLDSPLSLSFGIEGVWSAVDHEPHDNSGGFLPVEKLPRYKSSRLGLRWALTERFEIAADYANRSIISKRDQYALNSYQFTVFYHIPGAINKWAFTLGTGIGSNRTSNLTKTSYTSFDEYLVTRAQLIEPRDLQLQANIFASSKFYYNTDSIFYFGLGQAVSKNNGFKGIVRDTENCNYDFSLGNDSSAVSLSEPCGRVISFEQKFNDIDVFEKHYNLNTTDDVSGTTRYWQLGTQFTMRHKSNHLGFGYHYQRFFRGEIDERLSDRGGYPLIDNHTFSAWWHRKISRSWQVETGARYSRRPMLNRLFVLYTGFTNERFRQDAIIFRLTLRYRFLQRS
ncbi:MAG: hypothetical protein AB8B63_08785, partial [Granulosicoccus sp.]